MKMENEGRKIMHQPAFKAERHVRTVPVYRSHSIAVSAEFEKPVERGCRARPCSRKPPGLTS